MVANRHGVIVGLVVLPYGFSVSFAKFVLCVRRFGAVSVLISRHGLRLSRAPRIRLDFGQNSSQSALFMPFCDPPFLESNPLIRLSLDSCVSSRIPSSSHQRRISGSSDHFRR